MNKNEFLKSLKKALSSLGAKERKDRISFYSEIIDDKIEEGMDECAAVKEVGSVNEIARKILAEKTEVHEPAEKKGRKFTKGEIAIIIIGAPVWIPIGIALLALIFSGYVIAYSLLLALWATEAPFLLMSLLSKCLFPACTASTKALTSFTARSINKLIAPFKR